ncbi:MAG: hypothetical protein DMF62_08280 [Acidobacteria bacterium]|nr:MAG: hypothetical protein DMF62_08280 [Acidobacteriota bacterium]
MPPQKIRCVAKNGAVLFQNGSVLRLNGAVFDKNRTFFGDFRSANLVETSGGRTNNCCGQRLLEDNRPYGFLSKYFAAFYLTC